MAKLMVIDDDPSVRRALELRLSHSGFEVITSNHPDKAMERVLHERPDAILLDIEMPHFSGLEFHECLRVTERGKNIPVIYLSGGHSPSQMQEAFRQGARAFISKPYDPRHLIATVRGVLDSLECTEA